MSDKLQKLDAQLKELQLKKERVRCDIALRLLTQLEKLLDDDFSPELVMGCVAHMVYTSTPADYIKLKEQGAAFFRPLRKSKAQTLQHPQAQDHADSQS